MLTLTACATARRGAATHSVKQAKLTNTANVCNFGFTVASSFPLCRKPHLTFDTALFTEMDVCWNSRTMAGRSTALFARISDPDARGGRIGLFCLRTQNLAP